MTIADQTIQAREGEELDAAVIARYLKPHLPHLTGEPKIRQFPGGASNLTYLLSYPEQDLVLRRPPLGKKAKSAHDMGREFLILNRLNDGFPYCPKAYVHCTDPSVIGDEFYVMQRVEGTILRSDIPAELNLTAEKTKALCESFIDKMVELHQVDYAACGDRKSTRLNSSHVRISYAVFCLKKKHLEWSLSRLPHQLTTQGRCRYRRSSTTVVTIRSRSPHGCRAISNYSEPYQSSL